MVCWLVIFTGGGGGGGVGRFLSLFSFHMTSIFFGLTQGRTFSVP